MSQFSFRLPRAYRLKPVAQREDDALSLLTIGASKRNVLVPYSLGLAYVIASTREPLPIKSTDFHIERLAALPSLWARVRLAFFFKKRKYLKYNDFSLFSVGPRTERRRFTRYNRDTMNMGAAADSDLIAKHPELLYGWPAEPSPAPHMTERSAAISVAIVAHIYYEETWPDIAGVLRGLTISFDLIVTTVAGRERLIESIRRSYPRAEIEIVENRGRDIGPFMLLLERGRLDGYRYICKIHGKKSSDGGRRGYMGDLWRRRLLFDLLGAPGAANATIDRFERDPSIGMIGPRVFRLPNEGYSEDLSWSANRPMTLKIAERMGVPADKFRLDFFGGTMFWVRPEALKPLRDLRLAADMPSESGLIDGDLPHALERVLPTSVVVAGYKLANSDGYESRQAPEGATGIAHSARAGPPSASVRA
jgi:lipopolysaccharide biosynthesis protein